MLVSPSQPMLPEISAESAFDYHNARLYTVEGSIDQAVHAISRVTSQDNCESLYEKILLTGQPAYWVALLNNKALTEILFRHDNLYVRQIGLRNAFVIGCSALDRVDCQQLILALAQFALKTEMLDLHRFYVPSLLKNVPGLRQTVFSGTYLDKCCVQFITDALIESMDDFARVLSHFKTRCLQADVNTEKRAFSRCMELVAYLSVQSQLKCMMQKDDDLKQLLRGFLPDIPNNRIALGLLSVFPDLLNPLLYDLKVKLTSDRHTRTYKSALSILQKMNREDQYSVIIMSDAHLYAHLSPQSIRRPVPQRVESLNPTLVAPNVNRLCAAINAFAQFDDDNTLDDGNTQPPLLIRYDNSVQAEQNENSHEHDAQHKLEIAEIEKLRQSCKSLSI